MTFLAVNADITLFKNVNLPNSSKAKKTKIQIKGLHFLFQGCYIGRAYLCPMDNVLKVEAIEYERQIKRYIELYGLEASSTRLTTSENIRKPKDKSQTTWQKKTKTKIKWGSDNNLPVTKDVLSRKKQHGTFWFMFSVDNVGQVYVIARKFSGSRYNDIKVALLYVDKDTKDTCIKSLVTQIDLYSEVVKWVLSLKAGVTIPTPVDTVEDRKSLNKRVFSNKAARKERKEYRAKIEVMTSKGVIDAAKLPSQQLAVTNPTAYMNLVNKK